MANISSQTLYEQKQREFSVQGAGLTRFQSDFIAACNRAIARINRQVNPSTRISVIDGIGSDVEIELDEAYEDVFSDCVTDEMVKKGQRPTRKEFEVTYDLLVKTLDDRIDDIRQDMLNLAQDADTDGETSFIGLNRHP